MVATTDFRGLNMRAAQSTAVPVAGSRIGLAHVLVLVVTAMLITGLFGTPQADATYPGRNGKIAFVRANQIYTINSDGSDLTQLTTAAKNYRPEFSPSGRRIAFVKETPRGAKNVWVMKADGTRQRRVTTVGDVTAAPSWSPDGSRLAFASGDNPAVRHLVHDQVIGTVRKSACDAWLLQQL